MHDVTARRGGTYAEVVAAGRSRLVNGAIETRMRFGSPWPVGRDLDESATLRGDDPESWAVELTDLADVHDLPVRGGCCGTDERHALSLALRLARPVAT